MNDKHEVMRLELQRALQTLIAQHAESMSAAGTFDPFIVLGEVARATGDTAWRIFDESRELEESELPPGGLKQYMFSLILHQVREVFDYLEERDESHIVYVDPADTRVH